jgi:hypothetical protein
MDDFSKIILTGLLWYICHKFIRKALNSKKWNKWNEDDELDAKLGAIAAMAKQVLKSFIF